MEKIKALLSNVLFASHFFNNLLSVVLNGKVVSDRRQNNRNKLQLTVCFCRYAFCARSITPLGARSVCTLAAMIMPTGGDSV